MLKHQRLSDAAHHYKKRKEGYLKPIRKDGNLNDVLLADMNLVLPNDMLTKVDLMSMANSLEVRPMLLDNELIDMAFRLSSQLKMGGSGFSLNPKMLLKKIAEEFLPSHCGNLG